MDMRESSRNSYTRRNIDKLGDLLGDFVGTGFASQVLTQAEKRFK